MKKLYFCTPRYARVAELVDASVSKTDEVILVPVRSRPRVHKREQLLCSLFFIKIGMYYIYAIKSKEKEWIYVGITDNPERRLKQHNSGFNQSTKAYRPFEMFYIESTDTREMARIREKELKTTQGKRFLRKYLADFRAGLSNWP